MLQRIRNQVTKIRLWMNNNPATARKIVSYTSTFLSIFSALLISKEQDILLMIYQDGLSVAALMALLGAIWRTAVKAFIQFIFCLLFPSFFRKQKQIESSSNDV